MIAVQGIMSSRWGRRDGCSLLSDSSATSQLHRELCRRRQLWMYWKLRLQVKPRRWPDPAMAQVTPKQYLILIAPWRSQRGSAGGLGIGCGSSVRRSLLLQRQHRPAAVATAARGPTAGLAGGAGPAVRSAVLLQPGNGTAALAAAQRRRCRCARTAHACVHPQVTDVQCLRTACHACSHVFTDLARLLLSHPSLAGTIQRDST